MLTNEQFERLQKILPTETTPELKELFLQNAQFLTFKKGEIMVDENQRTQLSVLILSGSCIRFIITPSGEERATAFHTESFNPILGNPYIRRENSLVGYQFRANEPTEAMVINPMLIIEKGILDKEYLMFSAHNSLKYISSENQLHNHLMGLDSEAFFHWLLKNYGFLFQRFSAKDIANFMGVSATWLSLLKRKMTGK